MDIALLIPFFAIGAGVMIPITAIRLRHQQKIEEMRLAAGTSRANDGRDRDEARFEMLEDRVQVLERIITDQGYSVAAQIEALRDSSSIDQLARENVKNAR
jgi:hypothetical protein